MIKKLQFLITTSFIYCAFQLSIFAQAPTLGTAADFVLFSSNGAVSNSGISQITGNVGTNSGSSTAFGNVNGVMHDNDNASAKASADLLSAYNQLNKTTATMFPSSLMGDGQKLYPGIYSVASAATLDLDLTFDAQGDESAVFILKIEGAFSAHANSQIILINGAKACNVYWKVEGLVSLASGTTMRGTVIANNAAININTGNTLEGRALTTTGALTVENTFAYLPVGCGSAQLTGPKAPELGSAVCYGLFSADGDVSNSGISNISGDVGTNKGGTTGFDATMVSGKIHSLPDPSTQQCAADLAIAYNYLNMLTPDIELLYPAQFGRNLVLTPHTYVMKAAAALTDTIIMNAQGNAQAIFVIQVNGALSTSTQAYVKLVNGAVAQNIYWKIEGAVTISDNSTMRGTIICNNGALGALQTGVVLDGRALITVGALTTVAITSNNVSNCPAEGVSTAEDNNNQVLSILPNPFHNNAIITLKNNAYLNKAKFLLYNSMGETLMQKNITEISFSFGNIPSGIYFYTVTSNDIVIQSGRLIAE